MQPDNARKVVEIVCDDLYGGGLFEGRITHDAAVWMELTKMNPNSEVLEKAGEPSIEAYFWSREHQ